MLIDSHCHLADDAFAPDLAAVVARARAAEVNAALCILDAASDDERARASTLAAIWPDVRFAVGVHPHQAGRYAGRVGDAVTEVERALRERPDARAIGEIGLDFHYDFAPEHVQRDVLAAQVALAAGCGLPIVVHAREAEAEVLEVVRGAAAAVRGVFHCYTGDAATARAVLDAGFHVGIGGIVTFPRGDNVRDLLGYVPLDRVLVETDSPFLAPVPHRGGRNEPAWVAYVAQAIAGLLRVPADVVAERTSAAFEELFTA